MREDNNIPKGWVETTLGEILTLQRGFDLPKVDRTFGAYPLMVSNGQDGTHNEFKVKGPGVITGRSGSLGSVFLIKKNFWPLNTTLWIKDFKGNDISFIYYFLKSFPLERYNSGSGVPTLNRNHIHPLPIVVPQDIQEQKAIASILTSFDDKIELLQAQNETLENIAQTIFKEWFGKYQVGDELPEGWRVGKLGKEFDITIGRTPPRKETEWFSDTPTGKKWISIRDMVNSDIYISNTSEYLTDEAITKFNIPIIPKNTTIMSFKMTVGKLSISTEEMLSNEAIAHLKLKNNTLLSSEFIFLYLQGLDFNLLGSTSSIVTAINSTMIKNIEFVIPDNKTLKSFHSVILPLFEKVKYNTRQIQTLQATRDTLLPKLMSGQLRVAEFQEQLSEVM